MVRHPLLLVFLLSGLLGCGDDDAPIDGGGDGGPECTAELSLSPGDPDGHPEPLAAGPGQARAGRIEAAALPPNPAGLGTWAPGDFVLANDRVAVIIEDVGESDLYDPYGGKIVGIAAVRDGALVDPADFNEVIAGIGRFTVETESVTVLDDGSSGGAAVVRAIGRLGPLPFIDDIVAVLIPGDFTDFEVAVDYTLEPDAEYVDIRYTFNSLRSRTTTIRQPVHLFFQRERMRAYSPGVGFAGEISSGPVEYAAYVEDGATSYAWESPDGPLELFLEISGASAYASPYFEVPACQQSVHDYARLYIGGPGLDGLLEAVARSRGATLREVAAHVAEADGTPAEGVWVHADDASGGYVTRAETDASGDCTLHVPEGAAQLRAYRRGNLLVGPVDLAGTASTASLAMGADGFIHVTATQAMGTEPLPVRVQVVPVGELPVAPSELGMEPTVAGRLHVEYPTSGDVTVRVPVGRHRVVVSRGIEYELFSTEVDVAADATVEVAADMQRVVDTTSAMCGDFHIHTHRSPDAPDAVTLKLESALADGVEIAVRSDHDWIAEFEPALAEMGMTAWAYGVGSLELTTFVWGHFGVFPLDPDPTRPNGGAFPWAGRLPPAVFADVRARSGSYGTPTIIINHPRLGGFGGGYFEAAQYDPATTVVGRPEYWDEGFSLVEVFNDSDFDAGLETTVADWFSLLGSGRRVYAVGSSDSHKIVGSPVGYPRTCVALGTDDPQMLRAMGAGVIRDALAAGHAIVSGGIVVDAWARGDARSGDAVTGAAAREMVRVRVQAASWVDADTLRVYVDGTLTETIALPVSREVVRFDDVVEIPVATGGAGTWAVFVASGDEALDPVHPGRLPFGVTNPIFFAR